jgi:hypothetical protein
LFEQAVLFLSQAETQTAADRMIHRSLLRKKKGSPPEGSAGPQAE